MQPETPRPAIELTDREYDVADDAARCAAAAQARLIGAGDRDPELIAEAAVRAWRRAIWLLSGEPS